MFKNNSNQSKQNETTNLSSEDKLKEILERGCLSAEELEEVAGGLPPETKSVTSSGVTVCCW